MTVVIQVYRTYIHKYLEQVKIFQMDWEYKNATLVFLLSQPPKYAPYDTTSLIERALISVRHPNGLYFIEYYVKQ